MEITLVCDIDHIFTVARRGNLRRGNQPGLPARSCSTFSVMDWLGSTGVETAGVREHEPSLAAKQTPFSLQLAKHPAQMLTGDPDQ